jgi:hypothetical protein
MATKFKVKYRDRNRLAAVLRRKIRQLGLVDTGSLVDSIRISFEQEKPFSSDRVPRRNELILKLTINTMYYYLFLDEGATLNNGGVIGAFNITEDFLDDPVTQEIFQQVGEDFIRFVQDKTGKVLQIPNPTIQVWMNPIGAEGTKWNEEIQLR